MKPDEFAAEQRFLLIYCNDDGETRVLLKDHAETVEWLTENKPEVVITEPPEADPNYWPYETVLIRAVIEPGFSL